MLKGNPASTNRIGRLCMLALLMAFGCSDGGDGGSDTNDTSDTGVTTTDTTDTSDTGMDTTDTAVVIDTSIPNMSEWASSGHADITAEPFNHWNEDDPAEVSASCAKCHSTTGFLDFLGEDGSAAGTVEAAVPVTSPVETIECMACHNPSASALDSVTFPSGAVVTNLGAEARCMSCHQGRSSGPSVDESILEAAAIAADTDTTDSDVDTDSVVVDGDAVYAGFGFSNIHYLAAGATQYGSDVAGGYQFAGKTYDGAFPHVDGMNDCQSCHNPHSLEVNVAACASCHTGVTASADTHNIRMAGSNVDYDGDGDLTEGVAMEIDSLIDQLYTAIQAYAVATSGTDAIIYDASSYPYFFIDTNADGVADADEVNYGNKYATWTPNLLGAAYNYQYAIKDPGGFAHNGKYIIQLLIDSIEAVGGDISGLSRNDAGHFDGSSEAYRHWDGDPEVSATCARCHTTEGSKIYATTGVAVAAPQVDGMSCEGCHTSVEAGSVEVYPTASVTFPSGLVIANTDNDPAFICLNCHQGRESKATIDAHIADVNTNGGSLSFKNVHYLPAGAVMYGTEAMVGYEYDTKTYASAFTHMGNNSCIFCHQVSGDAHTFEPTVTATCTACHAGATTVDDIKATSDAATIDTLAAALYAQIQAVATAASAPIVYASTAYPYFFNDTNADGVADASEANYGNQYASWTEALLKAAHNYQIYSKEPGAWAHNGDYIQQLLIDSIEDLGGDVSGYTRP